MVILRSILFSLAIFIAVNASATFEIMGRIITPINTGDILNFSCITVIELTNIFASTAINKVVSNKYIIFLYNLLSSVFSSLSCFFPFHEIPV